MHTLFTNTTRNVRCTLLVLICLALLVLLAPSMLPVAAAPQQAPASMPAVATWQALPNRGLDGTVYAIAFNGNDMYVGGEFTQTKDGAVTNLNHIAKLNLTTNTWSALPHNGLNYSVSAIAFNGNDMYVGGEFTQTKDGAVTNLNYIAKFNRTSNTWSALPNNGFDAYVNAIAFNGNDMYVGGEFSQTKDGAVTNLGSIAKFNGAWSALPHNGLSGGAVYNIAFKGTDMYVAGVFFSEGDNVTKFNTITNDWEMLPDYGVDQVAYSITFVGNDMYVGGHFTGTAHGAVTNSNGILRLNLLTNTWSALPHNGLKTADVRGIVNALASNGTDVYVGGFFAQTYDGAITNLDDIAKFDPATNTWSALPEDGLNSDVFALAFNGAELYVGGGFHGTGDGSVITLGHIAKNETVLNVRACAQCSFWSTCQVTALGA